MLKEKYVTCIPGVGDHRDFNNEEDALYDAESRGCQCVDHYQFWEDGRTSVVSLVQNRASGQWVPDGQPQLPLRTMPTRNDDPWRKNIYRQHQRTPS